MRLLRKYREWKKRQKEIMEAEVRAAWCKGNGHIAAFSKRSELYWFGIPCACVRCGAEIPANEVPE